VTTERLTGLDASFLYLETPTLPLHVALSVVFDPRTVPDGYSFEKLRAHVAGRIPLAPVFGRRLLEVPLRLHHPVWVDEPDFDIDHHLRRAALPAPGSLHELAEFTADVISRPLDRRHPLWEMWIVEGVCGGNIAMVAKMHHSTIDGVSGAQLLGVLLDLELTPTQTPAAEVAAGDGRVPSGPELMAQAMVSRLVRPFGITRTIWRTGQSLAAVLRVRRRPEAVGRQALPLTAPRTSLNLAVSGRRRVAFGAASLTDVKRLKKALGATVNDVVLAICTGVLRQYLSARDELPDHPLVAVVPISVAADLAEQPGSNKVSAMFVDLPTDVADPLERVRLIHEDTKGAKDEHQALGADMLQNWVEHATPNLFSLAMRFYTSMRLADRHRPVANLVISNVPGPDFALYFAGAEMLAPFPLGPVIDGLGLNITIMSYRGVLYFGIAGSARNVPAIWDIADAVGAATDELLSAAGLEPSDGELPLLFAPSPIAGNGAVRPEPAPTPDEPPGMEPAGRTLHS